MISKTSFVAIFLLGFALIQSSSAHNCYLRLSPGYLNDPRNIGSYGEDQVAPFEGFGTNSQNQPEWYSYSSLRSAEMYQEGASNCFDCTLTIYSTSTFSGRKEVYDFNTDGTEWNFPFCAKSIDLVCPEEPEEEEEEEVIDEEQIEPEEAEEEEEYIGN